MKDLNIVVIEYININDIVVQSTIIKRVFDIVKIFEVFVENKFFVGIQNYSNPPNLLNDGLMKLAFVKFSFMSSLTI